MEWIVSPSKVLTWLLAIVREAAEVNPVLTGTDNKSIRKPSLRKLQAKMTRLVRMDNRTAYSGPSLAYGHEGHDSSWANC